MEPQDQSQIDASMTTITIRRHPFGLVALYLQATFGLIISLGLLFFLESSMFSGDSHQKAVHYMTIAAIIVVAAVAIIMLIATSVYKENMWIVTDDSIHQVIQRGIFSRQSSELSMANIEDVTADQRGILAELFGFGTLKCETAGELPYFRFDYCPNPEKYAKIIINARQRFITGEPEQANRANDLLNVPGEFKKQV